MFVIKVYFDGVQCSVLSVTGFVGPMLRTTSTVQSYVVHHRPALWTVVHNGDLLQQYEGTLCTMGCLVHHQEALHTIRHKETSMSQWTTIKWKVSGRPLDLTDIGTPCAPWCTMQVGGAQSRSVVHKVVPYHWEGAQRRSLHKIALIILTNPLEIIDRKHSDVYSLFNGQDVTILISLCSTTEIPAVMCCVITGGGSCFRLF